MTKIYLNIDGKTVEGRLGQSILEVAEENEIEIPSMCHDDRLEIYGSCGMCVVEVQGVNKLLRACSTMASDGMVIDSKSPKVIRTRQSALDLMLSDHTGDCHAPCKRACPGDTDCQGYVGLIANGEFKEALKLIKEVLPLPASIGRVCPHPCETACRRELVEEPISIAHLKWFVADLDLEDKEIFLPELAPARGKRVAIVGGGPGGLSAAYFLLVKGYEVTIYDMMPEMGGMLRYGIPEYRLPAHILDQEIAIIKKLGAKFENNIKIGRDIDLDYIRNNYNATYLSIGAWKSSSLKIKGQDSPALMGAIDFLRKVALKEEVNIGERVSIIGGGNTAIDVARTALRLGAKEVSLIYRRTEEEMPAESEEILQAKKEGVNFKFLLSPIEIMEEGGRARIKLQKMEMGEADDNGRRRLLPLEGQFLYMDTDLIVVALGQEVNLEGFQAIEKTDWGTILSDEATFSTNMEGVFAGGDAINQGPDIAIKAIGDARKAADIIDSYLEGNIILYKKPYLVISDDIISSEDFQDNGIEDRVHMPELSVEDRIKNFQEINLGFSPEEAIEEAQRCLECGCHDIFECKLFDYANQYEVNPEKYEGERQKIIVEDNHPFIVRDSNKCILCGLCVRVCQELMDNGALGLVDRGFDARVEPTFGLPLSETSCISCGQCVTVCPVGAIQEKLQMDKSVPLEAKSTETICSYCSIGCNIDLESRGESLYRALPNRESPVDGGLLCVKGRFGYNQAYKGSRLSKALLKVDGKFKEISWEEGLNIAAKEMERISREYGPEAVGISISDRYTNEEIYLAKKLANDYLGSKQISSFNRKYGGLEDVLGFDASTSSLEDLEKADYILLVGSNTMRDHMLAGLKIKKAIERGAKLTVINDFDSQVDDWASRKICPDNSLRILKEILKALIDLGFKPDRSNNFESIKDSLKEIRPSQEAREIAGEYVEAKRALLVFDESYLSIDGARLIANISVLGGQVGREGSGIIELKAKNNSQGLVTMGIDYESQRLREAIERKDLKGLMILGEDIDLEALKNLEFLLVQDLYMTPTAQRADLILPAVSYAESSGTYTSTERRIQKSRAALPVLSKYENWQVLNEIMYILGGKEKYGDIEEISQEISEKVYGYSGLNKLDEDSFWPMAASKTLHLNGYMTEDKKANLMVVDDGILFDKKENTDFVEKEFEKDLMNIGKKIK